MERLENSTPQEQPAPTVLPTSEIPPLSPPPLNPKIHPETLFRNSTGQTKTLDSPTLKGQPVLEPIVPQTFDLPPSSSISSKPILPNASPPPESQAASSAKLPEAPSPPPDLGPSIHPLEFVSPDSQRETIYNNLDVYNPDSILSSPTSYHSDSDITSDPDEHDYLPPPQPIFDLTPGRESSPARYKHGEPLEHGM